MILFSIMVVGLDNVRLWVDHFPSWLCTLKIMLRSRGIIRSVLFAAKTVIFGFFGLLKENLFTNFGIFLESKVKCTICSLVKNESNDRPAQEFLVQYRHLCFMYLDNNQIHYLMHTSKSASNE